jgi:DNA repair protein RecN (Recombination protein N)
VLRRLVLRDFVLVRELDIELQAGFTVLTGETGAGKSILIDALQLALGARGDAGVVREGAQRADLSAEFDAMPTVAAWAQAHGFDSGETLLLRRVIDSQGKSRAWINGSPATVAQLREVADALVDIHGQHAWQSLTRPGAVRALLDHRAGVDSTALAASHARWRAAVQTLEQAQFRHDEVARERDRLAWQIAEIDKLAPGTDEWEALNAEHQRLSNAQSLIDAARAALDNLAEADANALQLNARAADGLDAVARFDPSLAGVAEVLRTAQAQLEDAVHTLGTYLHHVEPEPQRLAELDARLSAWMGLARRWRRPPSELVALQAGWRAELMALEAQADTEALARQVTEARRQLDALAQAARRAREAAAPMLAAEVTRAMQTLGMAGGRLEVALLPQDEPQSFGLESVELRAAGHAGSTPRALAKVASGGELSRIALAIAVGGGGGAPGAVPTLIFDEIDAGIGGAVAQSVGQLMRTLGEQTQVLAVTHLPQVAACAQHQLVVAKSPAPATAGSAASTVSEVRTVEDAARVAEVARMLGGQELDTSLAHARQLLLQSGASAASAISASGTTAPRNSARKRSQPA